MLVNECRLLCRRAMLRRDDIGDEKLAMPSKGIARPRFQQTSRTLASSSAMGMTEALVGDGMALTPSKEIDQPRPQRE